MASNLFSRKAFKFGLAVALTIGFVLAVNALGLRLFLVGTGSMSPTLPVRSNILVMETQDLEEGDIITFVEDNGEVTTHRFIGYAEDGSLVTQGDANLSPDVFNQPLQRDDVIGEVIAMTPLLSRDLWLSWRGLGIVLLGAFITVLVLTDRPKKQPDTASGEDTRDQPADITV